MKLTKEQQKRQKKKHFKRTKKWLLRNYEVHVQPEPTKPSSQSQLVELLKQDVYDEYLNFCDGEGLEPVANSIFGKTLHKGTPPPQTHLPSLPDNHAGKAKRQPKNLVAQQNNTTAFAQHKTTTKRT